MAFECMTEGCGSRLYVNDTRAREDKMVRTYRCPKCGAQGKSEETMTEWFEPGVDLMRLHHDRRQALEVLVEGVWTPASVRDYPLGSKEHRTMLKEGKALLYNGTWIRRKRDENGNVV